MNKLVIGHLARVEGHGGITVHISDNKVEKVDMDIYEGSRLYEALLIGKSFREIAPITSRVCGICSVGHALCATKAIENAFQISPSPHTELLRELLVHGENIESHSLHVFFLALPDFFGQKSAFHMYRVKPRLTEAGLSLKKLGNRIQEIVGGRPIHPVNLKPGGFSRFPSIEDLEELLREVEKGISKATSILGEFERITVPEYVKQETTYVALSNESGSYGYTGDSISISDGKRFPLSDFRKICHERVVQHSTAKQSLYSGQPFMVGSLARIIINGSKLRGLARDVEKKLIPENPGGNPIYNTFSQVVELIQSLEDTKRLIHEILEKRTEKEEDIPVFPSEAEGLGALEVPRGTLYHFYRFNEEGTVVDAEIITPTAQNLANIERDLTACAESSPLHDRGEVVKRLEMIARAYDPCISCSVHITVLEKEGKRTYPAK